LIRRFPNEETLSVEDGQFRSNAESEPGELKHLSTRWKRKQFSDSVSSGERKRNSPNFDHHGDWRVVGQHLGDIFQAEASGKLYQRG
jgi:hypothetical protein